MRLPATTIPTIVPATMKPTYTSTSSPTATVITDQFKYRNKPVLTSQPLVLYNFYLLRWLLKFDFSKRNSTINGLFCDLFGENWLVQDFVFVLSDCGWSQPSVFGKSVSYLLPATRGSIITFTGSQLTDAIVDLLNKGLLPVDPNGLYTWLVWMDTMARFPYLCSRPNHHCVCD